MAEIKVSFTVNGDPKTLWLPPEITLLEVLRERLFLTGTKEGCGEGECGACIVLVNGQPVNSCLFLAGDMDGKDILTVEGLETDGSLSAIQESFLKNGGTQCGFCSSGMILSAKALLDSDQEVNERSIRECISGVICRCGTYPRVIASVLEATGKRGKTQNE